MPRDGSGVYSAPAGTAATANTTIESAKYNALINDLVNDNNAARPIVAGGTGATTAPAALVNLGLTATAAEINILDGVTASTAELNILDGVTATTAELNFVDGVTSNIQTQLDGKLSSADGSVTFPKLAAAAVVTSTEGIGDNTNDTNVPTSAAVADLVFGGYRGLWREEVFGGSAITQANGLTVTTLASGSVAAITNLEANHARAFLGTGVTLNCSTTVNSGCRVSFPDTLVSTINAPTRFVARLSFRGTTRQSRIRAGFHNATDHNAPGIGIFFDLDSGAGTITPVVDGFSVVNGTSASLTGVQDFVLQIDYGTFGAKFRVYTISATPSTLLSQDMAGPAGIMSNSYWNPQIIATTPSTTAGVLVTLHSLGFGSGFPW